MPGSLHRDINENLWGVQRFVASPGKMERCIDDDTTRMPIYSSSTPSTPDKLDKAREP